MENEHPVIDFGKCSQCGGELYPSPEGTGFVCNKCSATIYPGGAPLEQSKLSRFARFKHHFIEFRYYFRQQYLIEANEYGETIVGPGGSRCQVINKTRYYDIRTGTFKDSYKQLPTVGFIVGAIAVYILRIRFRKLKEQSFSLQIVSKSPPPTGGATINDFR